LRYKGTQLWNRLPNNLSNVTTSQCFRNKLKLMLNVGVTYTVDLWLVENRVVDFLLVLIELFSPALTVEAL